MFLVVAVTSTFIAGSDCALDPGEFFIVPRGVEHKPVAHTESHIVLFEPASTLNTGNITNERTILTLPRL